MTPAELEAFLLAEIPLTRAIGLRVAEASAAGVCLQAPLEANHNHEGVAFGGSLAALGALAGWSLLRLRLAEAGIAARVVIRRQQMDCFRPLAGALDARTEPVSEQDWQEFLATLKAQGKARLRVVSMLTAAGQDGARVDGEFVAMCTL